jgi:drug/metabolite transporter (DMT)-like permease
MSAAIALSVIAALLFAIAAACQQRAASRLERESPVRLSAFGLFGGLVRDRLWIAGWTANLAGFMAQATALHFGSIAVVQALLVTQLLFAIVLGTIGTARSVTLRDVVGAVSVSGGLAVLLSVRGAAPGAGSPDRGRLLLAFLAASVVIFFLVSAAAMRGPAVRAALLGAASGLCFAATAVLIKLTTADLFHRGVVATAVDWPGYALAATAATGLLLGQQAFAAGPLPAALTAMNMTNPVISYLFAVLAFHAEVPTSPDVLAALAGTCVLLAFGVSVLARSPSVRLAAPEAAQVPEEQEASQAPARPAAAEPRGVKRLASFSRIWR